MNSSDSPARVRVAEAACGTRTYVVDLAPEALPPVRVRDLAAAWDSARGAALAQEWGRPLMLRFRGAGGEAIEMALADADACCWAAAVDAMVGLGSAYGMSVCLRLLALVEMLPRAPWALALVELRGEGASIHPALMQAAARVTLSHAARFDPEGMRAAVLPGLGLAASESMPPALSRLSAGARA